MKCPHCGQEIAFAEVCPKCGNKISYGGNTVLYKATASGKLSYGDIFSNVFKTHTQADALRSLGAGPSQGVDMLRNWQKPWMFMWLFVFTLILTLLKYSQRIYTGSFESTAFMISLIIPLTISFLIWEMDIHRGVTILGYLGLLFIGGAIADTIAGHLNTALDWPAPTAAITEEPIKLLVCVVYISMLSKKRKLYCLDGLVIGAAVGAGFAFWENVNYAFGRSGSAVFTQAIARALDGSISGSHMLLSAPFVGALCYAMNGSRLKAKHFAHPLFLTMLAIGMGCHAVHNSGWEIFAITISNFTSVSLIDVILAVVNWGALLFMLRKGINQALQVNELNQAVYKAHTQAHASAALVCRQGTYAGSAFAVAGQAIVVGRDSKECNLVLKGDSVSRKHGMLRYENGRVVYRDLGSSNGSYINGKKIAPNADTALKPGDTLEIGSGNERFEVA